MRIKRNDTLLYRNVGENETAFPTKNIVEVGDEK